MTRNVTREKKMTLKRNVACITVCKSSRLELLDATMRHINDVDVVKKSTDIHSTRYLKKEWFSFNLRKKSSKVVVFLTPNLYLSDRRTIIKLFLHGPSERLLLLVLFYSFITFCSLFNTTYSEYMLSQGTVHKIRLIYNSYYGEK